GRGHALVQNGVDKTARLEIGAELRKIGRYAFANAAHVGKAADLVVFFQSHLNKGSVHAGIGSEEGGEVGHEADVGDDRVQVFSGHYLTHDVFDLLYVPFAQLETCSGRGLKVNDELASVGARKERNSHQRI